MGKVVLISGGSSGLGEAIARELSPFHRVIIFSPDRRRLKTVSRSLKCDFQVGDVSKSADIRRIVRAVVRKYRRIDCLINNAGLWIEGFLEKNQPAEIEKVLKVNTLGVMLLSREIIPYMKKQGSGLIINVISQAGLYAKPKRSVYNTSKWAITGFTKSLQQELSPVGIRVTGLYPGFMKTSLFRSSKIKRNWDSALLPEEVAELVAYVVSLPDHVLFPEVGIRHIKNI